MQLIPSDAVKDLLKLQKCIELLPFEEIVRKFEETNSVIRRGNDYIDINYGSIAVTIKSSLFGRKGIISPNSVEYYNEC